MARDMVRAAAALNNFSFCVVCFLHFLQKISIVLGIFILLTNPFDLKLVRSLTLYE